MRVKVRAGLRAGARAQEGTSAGGRLDAGVIRGESRVNHSAKRTAMNGVAIFWDFMSMHQHSVDYGHARIVSVGKKELMVKNDPSSAIKRWNISVCFDDSENQEAVVVPHHLIQECVEAPDADAAEKALLEGAEVGHSVMVRKPRSRAEEKLFNLAMKDVDVWYCSKCTTKLLMTYLPDNVIATETRRECSESGWPTFERYAADFLSDDTRVIDVGKLKYDINHWEELKELKRQGSSFSRGRMSFKEHDKNSIPGSPMQSPLPAHSARSMAAYELRNVEKRTQEMDRFAFARMQLMQDQRDLANAGRCERGLPVLPVSFNDMMDEKNFASTPDRPFVKKKYEAIFQDLVVTARRFKLDNCGASSANWRTFVETILKSKEEISSLNVSDNPALDLPLEELVALDCLKGAKVLLINETSMSGNIQLLGQLAGLEVLDISGCPKLFGISEDGAQVPMTDKIPFQECVKSLNDVLKGCRITWETPAKDVKTILKSSVRKISSIRRAASRRSLKKSLLSPSSKSPASKSLSP